MTLTQIKKAVDKTTDGRYYITHHRGDCISLTWKDGKTLNGQENEFFIGGSE